MFSGKPSLPALSTCSESPTQIRAPRWPAMIMSSAVRSGCPGAVRRIASFSVGLNVSFSNSPPPCSGRSAKELVPNGVSAHHFIVTRMPALARHQPQIPRISFQSSYEKKTRHATGSPNGLPGKNGPRGVVSPRPITQTHMSNERRNPSASCRRDRPSRPCSAQRLTYAVLRPPYCPKRPACAARESRPCHG